MCLCYVFCAKTAWQLVNRKADFFYKTNRLDSIRITNRIDSNRELECSTQRLWSYDLMALYISVYYYLLLGLCIISHRDGVEAAESVGVVVVGVRLQLAHADRRLEQSIHRPDRQQLDLPVATPVLLTLAAAD